MANIQLYPTIASLVAGNATVLGDVERRLLKLLFAEQKRDKTGVSAARFRADNDDQLVRLGNMTSDGWIAERDGNYLVSLVGLAELAATDSDADSLIYLCNHMFKVLRQEYKRILDAPIRVIDLPQLVDMPIGRIRAALPYFVQSHVLGRYTADLNAPGASIYVSERILGHQSFDEIVRQYRGTVINRQREREASTLHLSTIPPEPPAPKRKRARKPARSTVKLPKKLRTVLESYEVGKRIGEGGSGIVVKAKDENGDDVALKYLHPSKTSNTLLKRFRNEIRYGRRANHPNIMRVLDVGEVKIGGKAILFFVMPYYPSTLRKVLTEPTDRADRFKVFDQVLAGVAHAHASGVWHRDLKPENILISGDLEDVRVADFGIARFDEPALYSAAGTRAGDRLANFQYAAPEQRDRKGKIDHRVDIFALGLMLNELVTGVVPQGTNFRTMASMDPSFEALDQLVSQMICQDPDGRPADMKTVIQLLSGCRGP